MAFPKTHHLLVVSLVALAGCDGFDGDFRSLGNGFDTSEAALQATAPRPEPDNRGLISYPNYQVAIARRGDTVADVAGRLGIPASELAAYNGIREGVPLRSGETLVLPTRVSEPSPATGAIGTGPIRPAGSVDVAAVAGQAIDRVGSPSVQTRTLEPGGQVGDEPRTHRVAAGETAFSIARLYGVTPRALADWNGLGPDLEVREGQFLLIPVVLRPAETPEAEAPGTGSVAPTPPSAATPLPVEDKPAAPAPVPASPQMAEEKSEGRLAMPVSGSIIRAYDPDKNPGIDISAPAGTSVRAAEAGLVAAITIDTNNIPIIVLRHDKTSSEGGALLTVYAGVDDLTVEKGDRVSRGQTIAKVRAGSPSFLHFEVREGFESVDPEPYLN